ncbi:MAG: type II toxin-antitoxin system ParD family antitoxin [Synechococcales bacterium]|nr:type II toxin-antitoxin system ParD family antitoxin [Synechococcales bacterium]
MNYLTITLSDRAQAFIATQIASGRYATADELLSDLIEQAQQRADAEFNGPDQLQIQSRSHLNELLTEGLESGDAIEVTDEWWADS